MEKVNVLVINAGSSSLKFRIYQMPAEKLICVGSAERIGAAEAHIHGSYFRGGTEKKFLLKDLIQDHADAIRQISGIIEDPVQLIGHRVVHGGTTFIQPTRIDKQVKELIHQLAELAPLHNPVNLTCIETAEKVFPGVQQFAVFDTAFHHRMPAKAYRYAIPNDWYEKKQIRVFGFHGISHQYITQMARKMIGKTDAKIISLHLGNGCSAAAVHGAESLDTSMGFSPLSGLVMGTRSGDLDPSVVLHLIRHTGLNADEVENQLNHESGLKGLTGFNDMRDVIKAAGDGDQHAVLARELFIYRIRKYIGEYASVLNGVDAVVFSGGIGENDPALRHAVCADMDYLGLHIDSEKNLSGQTDAREIQGPASAVKLMVIPTNEELEIARQTPVIS